MEAEIKFQPIKKRKQIWLFIVFMILLGAGSAWLMWNKSLEYSRLSVLDSSSPYPSANLKSYRSEKFGVSFDYPADWLVNEKDQGLGLVSSSSLRAMAKDRGGINPEYADITVELKNNDEKLSLEDFARKYDAGLSVEYSQKKTIKIAGKRTLYFRDTLEDADQFPVALIFIKQSNAQVLRVSLHWFFDLEQNHLAPVFDTLITTLTWL